MTIDEILRRAGPQAGRVTPPVVPAARRLHFPAPPRTGVLAFARRHPWLAALAVYAFWLAAWGLHMWNVYAQRQIDAAMGG